MCCCLVVFRQEQFMCEGIVRFGSKWTLMGRECFQCIEGRNRADTFAIALNLLKSIHESSDLVLESLTKKDY